MDTELIVTGDEILRGAVTDTNSAWLLERLRARGARVRRVTAVGDVPEDLEAALREASSRAQLVVFSGGLGGTSDDLTAEVCARVASVPLVLDAPTLERLRERWARRNRPMPPGVEEQARVPQGAEVLANGEGTAPGFHLRLGRADCFFFAGVPREFRALCEAHLLPFVEARGLLALRARTLRCLGLTEAELDAIVAPIARRHGLGLGLRAAYPEVWATFTTEGDAEPALSAAASEAEEALSPRCFSAEGESLAAVVGRLCAAQKATVAVAESCTGGLLGAELTSVAGSSAFFLGGVISYANEVKCAELDVSEELLREQGAVSEAVARAMAEGVRKRLGATYALSVTGVAGPGGGSAEKPVGTVWIALAAPDGTRAVLHHFLRSDRESIRIASVASALDMLRRRLEGGPVTE